MRRREFLSVLGGTAATWPVVARAQPGRLRRLGIISSLARDSAEEMRRIVALRQAMQQMGWIDGQNLRIEYRWAASNAVVARGYAEELSALGLDIILCAGTRILGLLLQATRKVPIVFVSVADPVGSGFVDSLARPGGNATGFTNYEFGMSQKWLELLKEIVPSVKNVGVIRDPTLSVGIGQYGAIQAAASSLGVEVRPLNMRDPKEIERAVSTFSLSSNGGLIMTGGLVAHRDLIVTLAARHRLPTVYPQRLFVVGGGLISYGPDVADAYRRAASYVNRILKGEKPADLPVQAPTKYEFLINLKTAKSLGLNVPPALLTRADALIE